jgi:hypothetical protein
MLVSDVRASLKMDSKSVHHIFLLSPVHKDVKQTPLLLLPRVVLMQLCHSVGYVVSK